MQDAAFTPSNSKLMTEEEFSRELKRSLVILATSSSDKRWIYNQLFTTFNPNGNGHKKAGLDLFFTDLGSTGIAPRVTDEKTGEYEGNLSEKEELILSILQDDKNHEAIIHKLQAAGNNIFHPATTKLVGMTEDSGWELDFQSEEQRGKFLREITHILLDRLGEKDRWLIDKINNTGFPGPNLKPLQEHLQGSFNDLMEIIYDAARIAEIKELRYTSTMQVSFVFQENGRYFRKQIVSKGRLLTSDEYDLRITKVKNGEAINSNFIHIPDGQVGDAKTFDVLIREGLLRKPSEELPADYNRRILAEYLQRLIGKRKLAEEESKRPVHVATISTDPEQSPDYDARYKDEVNDITTCSLTDHSKLLERPNVRIFGNAEAIILIPIRKRDGSKEVGVDKNYEMLIDLLVSIETDPKVMGVPLILDNRTGRFNNALSLLTDAYAQGRLIGEPSLLVANTDEELKNYLKQVKELKQRAPVFNNDVIASERRKTEPLPKKAPQDEVFTVFIAGGHNNKSAQDKEDAIKLGYHCASKGWRIVTGAGCLEGSMGAVHTGYIQYHLDRLKQNNDPIFNAVRETFERNNYDAEAIIEKHADELEFLAKKGFIQRDKFYGYSTKALVEMESKIGAHPPAITYFDAGNMPRRLECLLSAGTKVFLHGGIGTDQESIKTLNQHKAALERKRSGVSNDIAFSDGTPDDDGAVFYLNKHGFYDALLNEMNMAFEGTVTRANRKAYNYKVENNIDNIIAGLNKREESWTARIRENKVKRSEEPALAS